MTTAAKITGGCQCGAVRFSGNGLGRASICHCRMCQKAFGSFYGALVHVTDLQWTRGKPAEFQSSNRVKRGFCAGCGTPLTYDYGRAPEVAIAALDNPELAPPTVQLAVPDRLGFVDTLSELPVEADEDQPGVVEFKQSIVSYQHPDHDTDQWPER